MGEYLQAVKTTLTFMSFKWFYFLILAGFIVNCKARAGGNMYRLRSTKSVEAELFPWAHGRGNESVPGWRGSVSHIYHKGSPHRPAGCDDQCIHELRINKTLEHIKLTRHRMSMKVPTWRGVVNSGYMIRAMAGEWYTTFVVGTARPDARVQNVQLSLDTGSEWTWMQCKPCKKCFPQTIRLFDRKRSTTFQLMTENDLFCRRLQNFPDLGNGASAEECRYLVEYADGSQSEGQVASDAFQLAFQNDPHVVNLGFGCGTDNKNNIEGGSGGVLALLDSHVGLSFPEQVTSDLGNKAFSYCLTALNEPTNSGFIIFGQASAPHGQYTSTRFVKQEYVFIFIDVIDMSVNGERLNVPAGTFDLDGDHDGGVMVDSGAPYSFLHPVAYDLLIAKLRPIFDQLGSPYYPPNRSRVGPCWGAKDLDTGTFPFPRIAWHLRDGTSLDLSVAGTYVLYRTNSHLMSLCVPFVRDPSPPPIISVIGGHSQINTLMYFDQPNQRLGWVYNAC